MAAGAASAVTAVVNVQQVPITGGCDDLASTDQQPACTTLSNGTITQDYAVTVSGLAAGQSVSNVTATFTISSGDGARAGVPSLPTGCLTSGVTPTSSISRAADGTMTVVCNMGTFTGSTLVPISLNYYDGSNSPNGSHSSVSMRATATGATASNTVSGPSIQVNDAPQWDVRKQNNIGSTPNYYTVNGTSQFGYLAKYLIVIAGTAPTGNVGNEDLQAPLTLTDVMSPAFPDAVLLSCGPTQNQDGSGYGSTPGAASCPGVGTTYGSINGGNGVPMTITSFANAGYPNYAYWIQLFVPAADGPTSGSMQVSNTMNPPPVLTSISGQTTTDPNLANNTVTGTIYPPAAPVVSGGKSYQAYGNIHGQGSQLVPNTQTQSLVSMSTNATASVTDPMLCDVFDVSVFSLVYPPATPAPAGYEYEYAVGPNSTNLMSGPVGSNGLYPYDSSSLKAANATCNTYAGPWATNPTTLGTDWENTVNMVRLVPLPGTSQTLAHNSTLSLYVQMVSRTYFNGGPNAGKLIPQAVQVPNEGSWSSPYTSNTWATQEALSDYVVKALGLSKSGSPANPTPGSSVTWTITPELVGATGTIFHNVTVTDPLPASLAYDPSCTVLPSGVTASFDDATHTVTFSYGDQTVGTRNYYLAAVKLCTTVSATAIGGTGISNTATVASPADPAAAPGPDEAYVKSWNSPSAGASVTVASPNKLSIGKAVDDDTPAPGQTYTYSLVWSNTATINFAAPDIIDVLPYNGDANGSSFQGTGTLTGPLAQPTLVSGGTGTVAGTWYYTTAAPSTISANPSDPANANPGGAGSIWQTSESNYAAVTAVRFISAGAITPGQYVKANIPLVSTNTHATDNTYINTANLFTATAPNSLLTTNAVTVTVPGSGLSVAKTVTSPAGGAPVTAAGQVIDYQFTVTNTGGNPLTSVALTDQQTAPAGPLTSGPTCEALTSPAGTCSGSSTTLAPGQSATFTATYTVTQADIDHGSITDSATATGLDPAGTRFTSQPSTVSVPGATAAPALSIVKSASVSDVAHFTAGQVITYTFVVTNAGNVTLRNVRVADTGFTGTGTLSAISCPAGGGTSTVPTMAPGTQALCTATYTLTTADVDAGSLSDTGTATATPPAGPDVAAASTLDIPAAQSPAISVVKSASPGSVHAAGDEVTYSFTVTNTGNTTLNGVSVTDTQMPPASQGRLSPVTCPDTTLAPGQFTTCAATYTVTQADIDHGSIGDTATAAGTSPAGAAVTSPPSTASVTADRVPGISIVKSASPSDAAHFTAGQLVTYTFVVANTGNVTLAPVTVTDTGFTGSGGLSAVSCPPGGTGTLPALAPGAQAACTATYTITQADVDAGTVSNTGTVTGTPPSGPDVTADGTVDLPAAQNPAVTIAKSASPTTVHQAGDQVTYTFLVTNAGNLTLHGITVDDREVAPASQGRLSRVSCQDATLSPGEFTTCTVTYTVTQADIDHGSISDTATATGTPPSGTPAVSPPADQTVTAAQAPTITVVKSTTTTSVTHAGQQVPYSFLVTNAGNVTLAHVTVTDTVAPPSDPANLSPVTCPDPTLAPGAQETCTATYTDTQADIDHGSLADSATVTGTPPATPADPSPAPLPPSPPSASLVPAVQHPGIVVLKTAAKDPAATVGPQVRYSFLIDNTGNVTLHNVGVTDVMTPPAVQANLSKVTCPRTTLAPLASMTCTATYKTTAADVARGSVGNTATAYGTTPSGVIIHSRPHTISTTVTGAPVTAPTPPALIPTGEGADAAAPGTSPALAAAGAAALVAGLLLARRRTRQRVTATGSTKTGRTR